MQSFEPSTHVVPTVASADLVPIRHLPADQSPAAVYLASLAPGSRRTMRQSLNTVAALLTGGRAKASNLDWSRVRYQHTAAVRAVLAAKLAPATVNKMLAALRGVLRAAWRLGQMSAEDFHRSIDIQPIKSETLPRGRSLAPAELLALFRVCADGTNGGARDAALLALLFGAGLRRSEAVALDLSDFEPESRSLTVRRGKGRKDRLTYLPNGAGDAAEDWIAVRGHEPGRLFFPVNKGGKLIPGAMSDQAVLYVCHRRARLAGLSPFTPHDLRRSYISHLLSAGADVAIVRRLAGHSSVVTTTRYDLRPEEDKRKASELLLVPYVRAGGRRVKLAATDRSPQ